MAKDVSETRVKAETRDMLNGCFLFQRLSMKQVEFTIPLMSMARILSWLYKKLPSVSVNSVILFKITGNYLKVLLGCETVGFPLKTDTSADGSTCRKRGKIKEDTLKNVEISALLCVCLHH